MHRLPLLLVLALVSVLCAVPAAVGAVGGVTEFSTGMPAGGTPQSIMTGPDGDLWFTLPGANAIGRITPTGQVTEFAIPTAGSQPWGIAVGSDGNLWFTEQAGNRVGRITPAGVVTEFPIAAAGMAPSGIVAGADGALWVAENGASNTGNNVLRITTAGAMTQYQNGISANAGLLGIAAGPDGNLWFTESAGNRIGRLLSGVEPVVTAAPQLSGAPVIGTALSVTTGTWKYLPTSYRYRWLRCTTAAATKCSTVPNQTKATYTITNADQGQFLRASVVAVNLNGTSAGAPTQVSAQIPTSAFTVTKPTIEYRQRDVLLRSTVTTSWAGRITQVGTTTQSGRTVRRCRVEQRVAGGGAVQIVCRLPYASRRTLRYTSLSMTITTTFQATDGPVVTKQQALRVPARLFPWRAAG